MNNDCPTSERGELYNRVYFYWHQDYGPEPSVFDCWDQVPEQIRKSIAQTERAHYSGALFRVANIGVTADAEGRRVYNVILSGTKSDKAPIDKHLIPDNYSLPDWLEDQRIHNWRNHVPEHVRAIWLTFPDNQRQHLAAWAEELARAEEWE